LLVIVRVPVCVPCAVGVKVTLIVQLLPGARVEVQVLVDENGPLTATLLTVTGKLALLVRVTL